jgi:hypothetical protein
VIVKNLRKWVLVIYRGVGMLTLYAMLFGGGAWVFSQAFYALSSSWVAPFIVAPSNEKILAMTQQLVVSAGTLNNLEVDRDKLQGSLGAMRASLSELQSLDAKFNGAILTQAKANHVDAPDIARLGSQMHLDNKSTLAAMANARIVEARIDADLAAGLITKADAAAARLQLQGSYDAATDNQIAEVMLRDTYRQKASMYTLSVDELAKEAELKSNIIQLQMQIRTGEEQLQTDKTQIAELNAAVATAKQSPYYLATKKDTQFAFVPYDNLAKAVEGQPVYACWASMVICHRVGTVAHTFDASEETLFNPVFKIPERGSIIQLELTEPTAAKNKVLFLGGKPLGI